MVQKHVNLIDLVKTQELSNEYLMIFLQHLASMQKRTIPIKFAHLAEKSENGSISNLSTKLETLGTLGTLRTAPARGRPGLQIRISVNLNFELLNFKI